MMLDSLLDASANLAEVDPKALAAELQTLAGGRLKFLSELEKGGHIQPPPAK